MLPIRKTIEDLLSDPEKARLYSRQDLEKYLRWCLQEIKSLENVADITNSYIREILKSHFDFHPEKGTDEW